MDVFDSIGELRINGSREGTAWVVSQGLAVSVWHCVEDSTASDEVSIQFKSGTVSCRLIEKDEVNDFALFEFLASQSPSHLETIARPSARIPSMTNWIGLGHASGLSNYVTDNSGLALNGNITHLFSNIAGADSMQLSCDQAANIRDTDGNVLGGISGGPVIVNLNDRYFVVGFIRETPPDFGEAVLFSTPIDSVFSKIKAHSDKLVLSSWDTNRGIPVIAKQEDGTVVSNIDKELVGRIWTRGIIGFWCNVRPDENLQATSAIERVLVHSPFVLTGETVDLDLAGATAWEASCTKYTKELIAIEGCLPREHINEYRFLELSTSKKQLAGYSFESLVAFAEHVENICNDWVFNGLRNWLSELFLEPDICVRRQLGKRRDKPV